MNINLKLFTSLSTTWGRILDQWVRVYTMSFRQDRCFAEKEKRNAQRRQDERNLQAAIEKSVRQRKEITKEMQLEKAQSEFQLARAVFEKRLRTTLEQEHTTENH